MLSILFREHENTSFNTCKNDTMTIFFVAELLPADREL